MSFKEQVNQITLKLYELLEKECADTPPSALIVAQLLAFKTTTTHILNIEEAEAFIPFKILMLSIDQVLKDIGDSYDIDFEFKQFHESKGVN